MNDIANEVESKVRPLVDAIKKLTGASTAAVLLKINNQKHLIGSGRQYCALILEAAGHVMGEILRDEEADKPAAPSRESLTDQKKEVAE